MTSDATIGLPCQIFLSDEGTEYCTKRGVPLKSLTNLEGYKGLGFTRPNVLAPLVQQLTANNLIKRIESEGTEFITRRNAVVDTTKLIVYGILYRRFRPTLNAILLDSEVVRYLRGSNALPVQGKKLKFDPSTVAAFVSQNAKAIRSMKASLLFEPHKRIDEDKKLDAEQKERKKQITRKFIDTIEDDTWFLFHYVRRAADKVEIMTRLTDIVTSFLNKTNIADAIAFMLMELVQNAETEHFKYLASKESLARVKGDAIYELLRDEAFRDKLQKKAAQQNALIHLVYQFDNLQSTDNSKRTRIRVSVTNKGRLEDRTKESLNSKKSSKGVREVSLVDHLQEDLEALGGPMGMVYYSYLEEACREENVKLESRFSVDDARNETTAVMTVTV